MFQKLIWVISGFRVCFFQQLYCNFFPKKPCLKVQNLQYKFLDRKCLPPWNFSKNLSVLEAPPVPKDFKRSSHLFQILQKSVNDEQYEIYKGPGSDGHVTSNLRIKALRVRLNCKMIQWEFEVPIYRIYYPFFPKLSIQKCRQFLIETWSGWKSWHLHLSSGKQTWPSRHHFHRELALFNNFWLFCQKPL